MVLKLLREITRCSPHKKCDKKQPSLVKILLDLLFSKANRETKKVKNQVRNLPKYS